MLVARPKLVAKQPTSTISSLGLLMALFFSRFLRSTENAKGIYKLSIINLCKRLQSDSSLNMVKKTALLILAEGAEEMEAVISADVLRRAGIAVTVAGLDGNGPVKCSRDIVIQPDMSLSDALAKGSYDAIVLPGGGKGAENLAANSVVGKILKDQEISGRVIGAICAAPAVSLMAHGIGEGKRMTCYPLFKEKVISSGKYTHEDEQVVVDDKLITSQGPGTAFAFGIALVEKLLGEDVARQTAGPMLL